MYPKHGPPEWRCGGTPGVAGRVLDPHNHHLGLCRYKGRGDALKIGPSVLRLFIGVHRFLLSHTSRAVAASCLPVTGMESEPQAQHRSWLTGAVPEHARAVGPSGLASPWGYLRLVAADSATEQRSRSNTWLNQSASPDASSLARLPLLLRRPCDCGMPRDRFVHAPAGPRGSEMDDGWTAVRAMSLDLPRRSSGGEAAQLVLFFGRGAADKSGRGGRDRNYRIDRYIMVRCQ